MDNTRYKSIQSWEELERYLKNNPGWFILDTGDRENRYRVTFDKTDKISGLSVDGRSVRVLVATGQVKIVKYTGGKNVQS